MALAACDMICTVPIALFFLAESIKAGIVPYPSWSAIHNNYSEVDQIPAFIWRNNAFVNFSTEFSRGLQVACAFTFFIFFGFAEEARKNYLSVYSTVAKRVGYSTGSMGSTGMSSGGITSSVGYAIFFITQASFS
jgi:pheromone a factor receptor